MESCVVKGGEEEEINEGEDEGDEGEEDDGDKGDADKRTSKVEVQKALGMGIPIHLSFLNVDRQWFLADDDGACSLPSAGDHSNIILGVTRSNHKEQGKFKDNVIKKNF